jgi:hypothetical protein
MAMNKLCADAYDDVDGAVAVGVVNLETGAMIGLHHKVAYFNDAYIKLVSEQAVALFNGDGVKQIESELSKNSGKVRKQTMSEMYMKTSHTQHFMVALPKVKAAIVLVTNTAALQAKGWFAVRRIAPLVQDIA